jgi:hypothetical protein
MFSRYALGSGIALATAAALAASCSSPEDPFTSGPASAAVTGVVTAPGGSSISGATVRIACAGAGPAVSVATDSTGRYTNNLYTGSDPFDGGTGVLRCHFTEPAVANARVQVDTALGFVRGPVLVALQFVDLHES